MYIEFELPLYDDDLGCARVRIYSHLDSGPSERSTNSTVEPRAISPPRPLASSSPPSPAPELGGSHGSGEGGKRRRGAATGWERGVNWCFELLEVC